MNTPTRSGLADVLAQLQAHARPGELAGMARFGIRPERRLGVAVPTLRGIAKTLGRDHALALQLWATGIPDAQILASLLAAEWNRPYPRELGAFPVASLKNMKYWPPVGRVDNVYGDRNLFCSCVPISELG